VPVFLPWFRSGYGPPTINYPDPGATVVSRRIVFEISGDTGDYCVRIINPGGGYWGTASVHIDVDGGSASGRLNYTGPCNTTQTLEVCPNPALGGCDQPLTNCTQRTTTISC